MALSVEQRGFIDSRKDAAKIRNHAEREFALLLLTYTHLLIWHEPEHFRGADKKGEKRSTLPDFCVLNTNTGRKTYVEITISPHIKGVYTDPKIKQKNVMRHAAPEERYVVLYQQNLRNIQEKNTQREDINFFGNRDLDAPEE